MMDILQEIAEEKMGEKLQRLNTWVEETISSGVNIPVYCLGESIMKLAEADVAIFVVYDEKFDNYHKGCAIERNVAFSYDIHSLVIDAEDLKNKLEKED